MTLFVVNLGPLFMWIKTKMSIYDFLWANQAILAFIYEITRNLKNYFIVVFAHGREHHWQHASYQTCFEEYIVLPNCLVFVRSQVHCFTIQWSTHVFFSWFTIVLFPFCLGKVFFLRKWLYIFCIAKTWIQWLWRYVNWEVPKQTLWGEWGVPKQTLLGEREVPKQTLRGEWEVPKQTLWGEREVSNFYFLTEISIGDRDLQVCPATTCTCTYFMSNWGELEGIFVHCAVGWVGMETVAIIMMCTMESSNRILCTSLCYEL